MHNYRQTGIKPTVFLLATTIWLFSNPAIAQLNDKRSLNTLNMGGGISFGMLGYAYDRKITDRVELRIASGMPFFWGGAWPYNVGARFYFKDDGFWNPRVSINYGTVVIENFSDNIRTSTAYNNYSIGLGQTFVFGRSRRVAFTLDMDFVYAEFPDKYFEDLDSAPPDNNATPRDTPIRFALGFGIRY